MTRNPFEQERDLELGALIREQLEAGDHAGFARAVMARVAAEENSWEVLGRWARPGIAAAIAFLAGVSLWFSLNRPADAATLADAMRPGDAPLSLFAAPQLDEEVLMQVVLE